MTALRTPPFAGSVGGCPEAEPAAVERGNLGLLTDLYQLTMLQAYLEEGLRAPATFSLFARRLPAQRSSPRPSPPTRSRSGHELGAARDRAIRERRPS